MHPRGEGVHLSVLARRRELTHSAADATHAGWGALCAGAVQHSNARAQTRRTPQCIRLRMPHASA
eukprot:10447679-Alexandrium_andersonii.AAC.1